MLKCITINTDASFNHEYNVGGYAFYIVSDYFKIQKSGMFRVKPFSPIQAEMMCMANAIHTLVAQPELPLAKLVVINSDALYAFGMVKHTGKDLVGRIVSQKLTELMGRLSSDKHKARYEFRHVKAHSGTPDARSWVNDWCDKQARKWMRKSLSIEKKQTTSKQIA